jgi:hypothetical protein
MFKRIIKLGVISIIAFALLITVFSLFFPSRARISKAIDINTETKIVMEQIKDINNWKNWYPGADSIEVLPEITSVTDTSVIASSTILKGSRGIAGWNVYPGPVPNSVTVHWYMDFQLRWYPWEKFSSLLLEKRYGPMMQDGLERLKNLLEK